MKIVSTGSILASPGFLEKKLKARRKRLGVFVIGLIILLVALVAVSRLQAFRIQEISVSGAKVTSADNIKAVVKDQISGYYLWLVPHDNALLYPKSQVRKMLFRKFPRFSSVELSVSDGNILEITVVEREPFALYCQSGSSGCYFLDKEGFIFDVAPTFSEGVYMVYQNAAPYPEPLGEAFLPGETFKELSLALEKLPALQLEPLTLTMSENEYEINLKSGASLLWPRNIQLARTFSNLESFLLSPEISGQKDFLSRVARLDLRTEDKVFYTFK